jgi:hypothetical protein
VEFVVPTSDGTCVLIDDAAKWTKIADQLADALARYSEPVDITAGPPPLDQDIENYSHRTLTALLGYSMDPPIEAGPFNERGVATYRWGVADEVTSALIRDATDWAKAVDGEVEVAGDGPILAATSRNAGELLTFRLQAGQQRVQAVFHSGASGWTRKVGMDAFGQVAYTEMPPETTGTLVDTALGLASVVRRQSAAIDVAMIQPLPPSTIGGMLGLPGGSLWVWNRHLWSSRVFDAAGIQVLTDAHLERANDLSGWKVERASDGRWLVSARELSPWYDIGTYYDWRLAMSKEPDPDHLVAARSDFGEMILTQEVAAAHPRQSWPEART